MVSIRCIDFDTEESQRPGQVQALLGAPLTQASGSRGQEWDYNLKFRLPQSDNYLVCQYKVVFDEQQSVRESVWRRRQCQDLAG